MNTNLSNIDLESAGLGARISSSASVNTSIYHSIQSHREDPAGYVDGLNLYAAYFDVNGVDPDGLSATYKVDDGGGLGLWPNTYFVTVPTDPNEKDYVIRNEKGSVVGAFTTRESSHPNTYYYRYKGQDVRINTAKHRNDNNAPWLTFDQMNSILRKLSYVKFSEKKLISTGDIFLASGKKLKYTESSYTFAGDFTEFLGQIGEYATYLEGIGYVMSIAPNPAGGAVIMVARVVGGVVTILEFAISAHEEGLLLRGTQIGTISSELINWIFSKKLNVPIPPELNTTGQKLLNTLRSILGEMSSQITGPIYDDFLSKNKYYYRR